MLGLGALVLAGVLVITLVIDPQRFKPRIAELARDATGRELILRGPLRLSWFPWLALETDDGALSGAAGEAALASWRTARVGARLWPLLRGQLALDRLQFDGLQLRLQRNAAGEGNWASLLARLRGPGDAGSVTLREIAGLSLRDATLEYRQADGERLQMAHWRLDTGVIRPGAPVSLSTAFDISTTTSSPAQPIEFKTTLTLLGNALRLKDLDVNARLHHSLLPASGLAVALKAAVLQGDLATQSWQLPAATVTSGRTVLQLKDARIRIPDAGAQAQMQFDLPLTSLRDLLTSAGVQAPHTRDATALQRFAASGSLDYSPAGTRVDLRSVRLDDTQLRGTIAQLRDADVVEFSLDGDAMNLDRYRAPPGEVTEPFVFPTAKFAALRARGAVTLQRAQVADAELRGVTLRLLFADGRLKSAAPPSPAK